ncbi:TetR family transcriptional regulator [Xanthobacter sp. V3C-3]|uniref:TetR/AcrR family transcriptional regulator n=1 Tax=Xanthobacter lutulentifluminis TaxID=3119935 RepID=UPI003729B610
MATEAAARSAGATRDRILDAAVLRFARHSYEETGLRDIAADVGVDVAYVHRCFGSKERLFTAALRATAQSGRLLGDVAADPARGLARHVFSRDGVRSSGEVGPLDILIHSLSSPKAAAVLRAVIVEDFIVPLSRRLDRPAMQEVSMIIAFLTGLGILRKVMELQPLQEGEGGILEHRIARAIACILGEGGVEDA